MKLNLLINVKMPTIVDILMFISRINTTSACFRAKKTILVIACFRAKAPLFFTILVIMGSCAQLIYYEKSFITLGPDFSLILL